MAKRQRFGGVLEFSDEETEAIGTSLLTSVKRGCELFLKESLDVTSAEALIGLRDCEHAEDLFYILNPVKPVRGPLGWQKQDFVEEGVVGQVLLEWTKRLNYQASIVTAIIQRGYDGSETVLVTNFSVLSNMLDNYEESSELIRLYLNSIKHANVARLLNKDSVAFKVWAEGIEKSFNSNLLAVQLFIENDLLSPAKAVVLAKAIALK